MIPQLTESERSIIDAGVQKCREALVELGPAGLIADLAGIELVWDENMTGGVLGAYHWFYHNEIRLSPVGRYVPGMMVPVVCHELRHVWQHRTMGLKYVVLACRWWNRWTVEPSAYKVQEACERVFET